MSHLKRWGSLYILLLAFFLSWYFQYHTQWIEFVSDQHMHGEVATRSDFWPEFWEATLENWQSEFLQLAVQCLIVQSYFQKNLFQADHSADKDDVERIISAIEGTKS